MYPDPNELYDASKTLISTFNSITDTNQFLNTYNHSNRYNGLKLGQRIQINDGTYNTTWYIAGFDLEHNRVASDGTTYDNGYGIALVPEKYLTASSSQWDPSFTTPTTYINSYIHKTTLSIIPSRLKNVLGEHLIERNVLLSSEVNNGGQSTAYTWTTSYATLLSVGQLTGTFASHNNKYDDGEANYKLPLFNFIEYNTDYEFWLRNIYGLRTDNRYYAYIISRYGDISSYVFHSNIAIRPLIYIR